MQIMKKKNVFCLLFVAFLLLKGTSVYAGNRVTVDAAETTATFTWPTDLDAGSYQIDIYKDGTTFCHLTLGPKGQLLAISFNALRRSPTEKEQNASLPSSLSFMVTGLDAASRYNYVLSALDANGTPLHVYIGDFATTGYTGELQGGQEVIPTPPIIPGNPEAQTQEGMETVTGDGLRVTGAQKVLINGQLYLMYEGKMYDVRGIVLEKNNEY